MSAMVKATRKPLVVTCEGCGVEFCPLAHANRRRFCGRSCANRNNRNPPARA